MKKMMNTILGMTLALTIILSGVPSVHASSLEDGTYTAEVNMYKEGSIDSLSMCASIFAEKADITIQGGNATISIYVASPIPAFEADSEAAVANKGGVISNVIIGGTNATVTTSTVKEERVLRTYNKTNSLFGTNAGDVLYSDMITVTLPVADLSKDALAVTADVNVVMGTNTGFNLVLSSYEKVADDSQDVVPPVTTETQSSTVTATVPVNETTFTVEVPSSIGFGELSYSEDTTVSYDVSVSAVAGNDGKSIQVKSEGNGTLSNVDGSSNLSFTNNFGTKTFNGAQTVSGSLVVSAADAKAVVAGAYAGTITFEISTVE